jgi:PPOX class probable F420-dependent enzyme
MSDGFRGDARVDNRLRAEPILWIASARPNGRPHLVPVWFWWDGATILVFSKPTAQKVRNVRHSPHVVVALDTADQGEDVVKLQGEAELTTESSTALMPREFERKYAALFRHVGSTAEEMKKLYSQPIRIRPTKRMA